MTLAEFDNGYWYAAELKEFGENLGIPSAKKLRKDELEKAIKSFLKNGTIQSPKRSVDKKGISDLARGLSLKMRIENYTSNRETKDFIKSEAEKISPGVKKRSGAGYRLNRWREEQITNGVKITYGDLVNEFIRINTSDEPFVRIPHGRYINFLSDFMRLEKNATREAALKAWHKLKTLDISKDYASWVAYRKKK
jgi:hypothetical protein